jgi:hypothetical protein
MTDNDQLISFERWSDPVVEALGFPARSNYAEFCVASVIGPTALLALRAVSARLEVARGTVIVELGEFGRSLGVGTGTGSTSVIRRSLQRLEHFGLARAVPGGYAVRTSVAPLTERQLRRAGPYVERCHRGLVAEQRASV